MKEGRKERTVRDLKRRIQHYQSHMVEAVIAWACLAAAETGSVLWFDMV